MGISYAKVGGPPANWKSLIVYLNGTVIPYCIEAKAGDPEGWAVCCVLDSKGRPQIDDTGMIVEKLSGKVVIVERNR